MGQRQLEMTPERFEIALDSFGGLFTEFCPQGEQDLELLAPRLSGQDPCSAGASTTTSSSHRNSLDK